MLRDSTVTSSREDVRPKEGPHLPAWAGENLAHFVPPRHATHVPMDIAARSRTLCCLAVLGADAAVTAPRALEDGGTTPGRKLAGMHWSWSYATRGRRHPPEASRPARRVCSWSSSPWQGGLHSPIVTGEREESLPLLWFRDKLRLTVRRQVPVVVAIEHVGVVDHLLPDGGGGLDVIG